MPSFPSFLSSVKEHALEEDTKERECIECDDNFFLTSGEIDFYVQHELETPKRCKSCRQIRKEGGVAQHVDSHIREEKQYVGGHTRKVTYESKGTNQIICNNCNRVSKVPFTPEPNRPVYCPTCWNGVKNSSTK